MPHKYAKPVPCSVRLSVRSKLAVGKKEPHSIVEEEVYQVPF